MTKDLSDYLDEQAQEWFSGQDGCCSCHINPPCSWCTSNYSLSLAEYLEYALEEYEDPHGNYDRAMGVIGDF